VDLFTPDASYRSSVFREPFLGSDAIRSYWQRGAGTQREVAVRMGRPIITDDRMAVEWWTTMIDRAGGRNHPAGLPPVAFRPRWPLSGPVGVLADSARQARPAHRLGDVTRNLLLCPHPLQRRRPLRGLGRTGTLIILMPGCVVEDLAGLMMAEAAQACRQQDHSLMGRACSNTW